MAFWSNKDTSPARKYRFKVGTAKNINWWYANSVSLPSFEINTNEYQLINQKFKYPGVPTWNDVTISIVDVADSVKEIKKLLKQYKFDFLQVGGIQKVDTRTLAQLKADKIFEANIETKDQTKAVLTRSREGTEPGFSFETKKNADKQSKDGERSVKASHANEQGPLDQTTALTPENFQNVDQEKSLLNQAQKEFNNRGNDFVIEQMKSDGKTLRTWTLVNSFIKSVNYGDLDYGSDELVSIEIVVSYDYATTEK
jgi:hypothetical protein